MLWMTIARQPSLNTLTYSRFLESVRTGQVAAVVVLGSNTGAIEAVCTLKNGNDARTILPADYRDAMTAMQDQRVDIEIRDSSSGSLRLFANATPFLLL